MRDYAKSASAPSSLTTMWWRDYDIEEFGIPCDVLGGRKYQGEGVLVKLYNHKSYYGSSESVSVWTGEKMEFVNPRFVKVDTDLVLSKMYEVLDDMSFDELYKFINEFYDSRYDNPTTLMLERICPIVPTNRPSLEDKRRNLREWVADKFCDKTPEEQEKITHCIMMKKYGKDTI